MDAITTTTTAPLSLHETIERAREFADSAKSANTRRAYRSDFQHFATWCHDRALTSLPATPETMALYLSDLAAAYKLASIERKRAAIVEAHKLANHEPPTNGTARVVMQGIRRKLGKAQKRKTAATVPHLVRMVSTCEDTTLGIRDRALLLFGFAGAFRRSELVALDYEDLEFMPDGPIG
jgi:site-specific recombinase XerD